MDSYSDRINKFNEMINTTNDHINAVQEAATKFKDSNDPVGLGLTVTGAAAGGIGGIAGSIAGIQHFKDYKAMYKGINSKLSNVRNRVNTETTVNDAGRGGNTSQPDPVQNSGGNAADENAPAPASQPTPQANASQPSNNGVSGADVDGGLSDRINNLDTNASPNTEANSINSAINDKVTNELGANGKSLLNQATSSAGRGSDPATISNLPDGPIKVDAQKDFLTFKNNVANDAVSRSQNGQTQASGYDNAGNPTGDLPGPQPQASSTNAVQQTPNQSGINNVAPDNSVNLAPNPNAQNVVQTATGDTVNAGQTADTSAQGIVAQGRAALSNLVGGQQVPGSQGQAVQGLKVQMGDLQSQGANAGARIQQNVADQSQHALSPTQNPNSTPQSAGSQPSAGTDGNAGGGQGLNPGQGSSAGANASDGSAITDATNVARSTASDVTSAATSTASDVTEGLAAASGVGDVLDTAAAFSGPAAPVIGLIGGLVSLGTTIAGLFHHKPSPQKQAPPPAPTSSVGGNLQNSQSGFGAGIF